MVDFVVEKRRINKKTVAVVLIPILLLGLAWQLSALDYTTPRVSASEARIVRPAYGNLSIDILGSGRIKAVRSNLVVAREPGDIVQVAVRPGTELDAGELIVQLLNTSLQEELRQAEAELHARKNTMVITRLELKESRGQYVERVNQSRNDYETAKGVLQANEELMSLRAPPISRLEYERSQRDYRGARERHESAITNLRNYDDIEQARLRQMELELNSLENNVKRLEQRLSDLSIVMPEAGVVQELHVESGQRVNSGDQIAATYAQGEYYLELEVPALRANRVSLGMPAVVSLAGEEYQGRVARIDPQVRGSQVLVDIMFEYSEPERIQVNMFANARILMGERENVLVMPTPQNAREFGTMNLYVIDPEDSRYALYRPVVFGAMSASLIEVVSGLMPSDHVIISDISRQAGGAERVRLK